MFSSILMVCVGNICRSPTAEYLLKKKLDERGSTIKVSSAGIGALVDKPAAPKAVELAAKAGVDLTPHKARQLTREMAHGYDLILVMEQGHNKAVEAIAPEVRGRVHLLGHWHNNIEIPDPYRQGLPAYEQAFTLISTTVEKWIDKLCK